MIKTNKNQITMTKLNKVTIEVKKEVKKQAPKVTRGVYTKQGR